MKQAFGIGIPRTLEEVCDPARLALLIYDMQVGIVSQVKGADVIVAQVRQVLEAARKAGVARRAAISSGISQSRCHCRRPATCARSS